LLAIPCEQAQAVNEQADEALRNGEAAFIRLMGAGAAAGNEYEQVSFRNEHQGTRHALGFSIHHGDLGNYTPGTARQFDRPALESDLMSLIRSLAFIDR
jgi:hypothetical protein